MDNLFVQFYQSPDDMGMTYTLINGFSDTLDLVKTKGDVIWLDTTKYDVPLTRGRLYVSATYTDQIYKSYLWAKENPGLDVIVGGPACGVNMELIHDLPPNLTITTKSVEDWFGVPDFSGKWKLEPPKLDFKSEDYYGVKLDINPPIRFTYKLEGSCYWGKCNFCTANCIDNIRVRKDLDFEFKNVEYNGKKNVCFGTDALEPFHIANTLPRKPKGFQYYSFIRGGRKELEYLKKIDPNDYKDVIFFLGLEFPTDRMWNWMNKGYKTEVIHEFIELLKGQLMMSFIVGWDNLIEEDIDNLERFMERLPEDNKSVICLYDLFVSVGTPLYYTLERKEDYNLGPLHMGFWPKFNEEINRRAQEIITKYSIEKKYTLWDCIEAITCEVVTGVR